MATQVGEVTVMSLVLHKPPPAPPAHTVFPVLSFASTQSALVRPPLFDGPRSVQLRPATAVLPIDFLRSDSLYFQAASNLSRGTSPVNGSWVILNSCSHARSMRSR